LKAAVDTEDMAKMTDLLMREAIDHINEHVDDESKAYHVWLNGDKICEAGCN
jgi:UDP-N-acetyl-D-mannosaminuronic acid transferase (WecB/TagA/CpsF family)